MFDKTREFLVELGLPAGDAYDLPTSDKRFPDGAHFHEFPPLTTYLKPGKQKNRSNNVYK